MFGHMPNILLDHVSYTFKLEGFALYSRSIEQEGDMSTQNSESMHVGASLLPMYMGL